MANLLEKASIVLTPTAYNNGEALCVKPDDGSGDFDFSRNSAATRVNSQGLVENVQTISGNLLDYSTFTSPSASWSLVGGLWVFDDTANGFILTPNIAVVVGDVFDVVVDVTIASGNANFRYASGNAQTTLFPFTDFVDGVNEFQATITGVDGDLQRIFAPASLTDNPFTLNSISIKKISQDTNLPRINYEGGCGSWLFEPQSTNLITYSEDFSNAVWVKINSSVASGFASPSGNTNAYKLIASVSNTDHRTRTAPIATAAVGTTVTFSIYIKPQEITKIALVDNWTNLSYGVVNLTTNSVIEEAQGTTSVTEILNGFRRVSFTYQTANINTLPAVYLLDDAYTSGNPTSYTFASDGTSGVYIWGAQLEQKSYATSYIPTNGEAQRGYT